MIHPDLPAPAGGWPGERVVALHSGWETCRAPPAGDGSQAPGDDAAWQPAVVPGVAGDGAHDCDVWYRLRPGGRDTTTLRFAGLAGLSEVWLDGVRLAASDSMFVAFECEATPAGDSVLHLRFRSLSRALARPRPGARRPRWRTRLVEHGALRSWRQTLLGHMPGWCPPVAAVGPHRRIEQVLAPGPLRSCRLSASLRGTDGVLAVRLELAGPVPSPATLHACGLSTPLVADGPQALVAELVVPGVAPWWPHTHGAPALHEVHATIGDVALRLGRAGFRSLAVDRGGDGRGFRLVVNGVAVFCRGACWTSAGLAAGAEEHAPWLRLACEAGMNMVRVGGTMAYESDAFHALCDEMGLLVWQDFMFANLDYPADDPEFLRAVRTEACQLLSRLAASPSLAVLCGGSEVAQQAAMLGLDASERRSVLFDELLPSLAAELCPCVPYVAGSPSGGGQPFSPDAGVSHYYGVGAYLRPLDDARRANVRFASECLALANPASAGDDEGPGAPPRDRGASWDFADVRDHYLDLLYGVSPALLRREDPERYAALSRAVSADLMESVLGEWRRPGSTCGGALVWQLGDLSPGAGWGVIDWRGCPKPAWHGMARVLSPVQVLLSDEGLNGLGVHLLNDTAEAVPAVLDLRALRAGAVTVAQARRAVTLAPRTGESLSSMELSERFFDFSRAYRFGPAEHDVTVATLRRADDGAVLSEAFHFPCGRALPPCDPGLRATLVPGGDGAWVLSVAAERFAQAVQVEAPGFRAATDWFHLAPGPAREIVLHPLSRPACEPSRDHPGHAPRVVLRALNALSPFRSGGPP